MNSCPDCGVRVGQPHQNCRQAICMWSGHPREDCEDSRWSEICRKLATVDKDMADELVNYFECDIDHDCGNEIWLGMERRNLACEKLDFWCYWGPPWIECSKDHPGAVHSLNELYSRAKWSREKEEWVLR